MLNVLQYSHKGEFYYNTMLLFTFNEELSLYYVVLVVLSYLIFK